MQTDDEHIKKLIAENEDLRNDLFEANSIIDAIRDGAVDALVLNKDGKAHVYSMESADYTYRILIEKFGEGALSIADDGLILYSNDYFSKLVGIPSDKITGTFFHTYVDSEHEFQALQKALVNGPSKGEIILTLNGRKVPVYVSLTDLNPNVNAIGVVVTDLTEKRKNEEALIAYQRQLEIKVNELHLTNTNLEQFIHVISHDLKEPIRKLVTYAQHMSDSFAKQFTDDQKRTLNIISASAERLNALVDDLVKYAFSANKVEATSVSIDKVLAEVLDDLELIITENNAKITHEALPVISGSRVQMRQLFSNIISNAIKYSRKDVMPEILISASIVDNIDQDLPHQKFHEIQIQDNGIGMDKMYIGKIFTIFQRLHMRNEYSGNGIGLAICKKIMENHQGKIKVKSTVGTGSIFYLYFPISD